MNKLIAIGNVGRVEIKQAQQGNFAVLSLACTERWKDAQGQKQERTEWFDCVINGGLVGVVEQFVDKGTKLYIEASAKTREYEHQGQKRKSTSWNVRTMEILGNFKGSAQGQQHGQQQGNPFGAPQQQPQQPQQPQQQWGGQPQQPAPGGYPPPQAMAQAPQQQAQQAPQQQWDDDLPF